jgi:hypothetical protein
VPESWLARPEGIAIAHLATPWGELGYRLARRGEAEGGGVRYVLEGTTPPSREAGVLPARPLEVPPGGFVFAWPLAGRAGAALVDGEPVAVGDDGRVVVRGVPAIVELLPAPADEGSGGAP